jgi:WD40 repeat protein
MLLAMAALAVSTVLIWRAKEDLSTALEGERQKSYYHRIALADSEWSANNLSRMEQLLDDCPADLRGWEWHYLKRLRYNAFPRLSLDGLAICVAFSPDGERIACCGEGPVVKLWDARTGLELRPIRLHEDSPYSMIAFSPDGQHLASTSWKEGSVKIWDTRTGEQVVFPRGPLTGPGVSYSVSFSRDGQLLAGAFLGSKPEAAEVKIWEAATGRERLTLKDLSAPRVMRIQFSPDSRRIATGDSRGTVNLWDVQTGEKQLTLRGPTDQITGLAFSPKGQLLAVVAGSERGHPNREVVVWDADTGQLVRSVKGHVGSVQAVAFSPDGRRLASGGIDQTIKLWDMATGQETLTLRGHVDTVYWLAFSPDATGSHRLASIVRSGSGMPLL